MRLCFEPGHEVPGEGCDETSRFKAPGARWGSWSFVCLQPGFVAVLAAPSCYCLWKLGEIGHFWCQGEAPGCVPRGSGWFLLETKPWAPLR